MKMRFFLKYWFPLVAWGGVIFYLSHLPGDSLPAVGIPHFDKLAHALEFGIFAVLLFRSFKATFPKKRGAVSAALTVVVSVLFAVSDECHQLFVSGRVTSPYDLVADSFGIFLFLTFTKKD